MRLIKQLLYGLFFAGVLSLIGFGIYYTISYESPSCSDNIKNQKEVDVDCGGPCIPCELKNLKVESSEVLAFALGERDTLILLRISNPSENYGSNLLEYNLEVFHKFGPRLTNLGGVTSLLPRAQKYIAMPLFNINSADVGRIDFTVTSPNWVPKDEVKPQPEVNVINLNLNKSDAGATVSGEVVNIEAVAYEKLQIIVVGLNAEGIIVSASILEPPTLEAFANLEFSIILQGRDIVNINTAVEVPPR
ncbi:MAG: hypothetical protein HYS87_00685 [Candidatus Colwellbacteria bacterium]|nr:hypothetical protein [Candidatus Colwellbacteria bacterium]